MIIDDQPQVVARLSGMFAEAGIESVGAGTEDEALAELATGGYRVALIDSMGDGWHRIVEAAMSTDTTPIILSGDLTTVMAATREGITTFDKKELREQPDALQRFLRQVIAATQADPPANEVHAAEQDLTI